MYTLIHVQKKSEIPILSPEKQYIIYRLTKNKRKPKIFEKKEVPGKNFNPLLRTNEGNHEGIERYYRFIVFCSKENDLLHEF